MRTELTRFRVLSGKSKVVEQRMTFLNTNMEDVLLTLEGEKMYVETIFREVLDGVEYLYWYSIQGEGGIEVEESENYIHIQHLRYWEECIDPTYGHIDLSTEVVMIPQQIRDTF